MIIGSDKVIEWIRTNETPYWRIMNSEKGGVIFTSKDDDTLTVDDSVARLQEALQMLGSNTYFMDAWYTGQNQNARFKTRFVLNGHNTQAVPGSIPNLSGMVPQNEVDSKIAKAIEELEQKREMTRLKEENNDLKQQVDNFWYRVFSRVEPYLDPAIKGLFPELKPAITGNSEQTKNIGEMNGNEQQRLENAFESWGKQDADCITLVEKIAKLAETDPATYKMAKQILMSK